MATPAAAATAAVAAPSRAAALAAALLAFSRRHYTALRRTFWLALLAKFLYDRRQYGAAAGIGSIDHSFPATNLWPCQPELVELCRAAVRAKKERAAAKATSETTAITMTAASGGGRRRGKGGTGGQRIAVDHVFYERLRRLLKIVIPGVQSKVRTMAPGPHVWRAKPAKHRFSRCSIASSAPCRSLACW